MKHRGVLSATAELLVNFRFLSDFTGQHRPVGISCGQLTQYNHNIFFNIGLSFVNH